MSPPATPLHVRVVRKHMEAQDICSLMLEPLEGPLPPFTAGAHIDVHLYVCGPQGFMDAVLKTARDAGWDESRLHHEFFGAAPTKHASDGRFELELVRSGRVIPVAGNQTALQALLDAGIDTPTTRSRSPTTTGDKL